MERHMRQRVLFYLCVYCCFTAVLCGTGSSRPAESKPNIHYLGYGDPSCYGHPTSSSPNIDKMASEGLFFTQFYTGAPVCSPSRATLLTGRFHPRSGVYPGVFFPDDIGGFLHEHCSHNICRWLCATVFLPLAYSALSLLSYRWYTYKKLRYHYFMFDFCYFTNVLLLFYIWLPLPGRGILFSTLFSFANGPLLIAIVLWKNSLVPHSTDKMTSLFIHVSPVLTVWGIRWHSTTEQGFPLCYSPSAAGPGGCHDVDMWEIVVYPMLLYIFWQLLYIAVVEVWRREHVENRKYETSYKWLVERAKKGFLYRIFTVFGPRHRKTMFIVWSFVYTTLSILLAYLCYHYNFFNILLVTVVMTMASYNGACFYIDIFSQRYYFEKVLKMRPSVDSGKTE